MSLGEALSFILIFGSIWSKWILVIVSFLANYLECVHVVYEGHIGLYSTGGALHETGKIINIF